MALVPRGICSFRAKALAAQRAGAAALLIADAEPVRGSLQRTGIRVPVLAVGASAAGLAGKRVRVAVDAVAAIRRSPSVIGETGAAGAGRVVMAGGHLDSVPQGPGLNDNGSGVAATLEIAEELGGRRLPAGTALRFGFWGAEEIGLIGSRRYVDALSRTERGRIAAYVNLDMVSSPGAEPAVYDGDAAIEAALARHLGPDAPRRDLGNSSDHAPFAAAGIPWADLHRPRRLLPPALRHDRQRRPRGPDHVCAGSRRRARGPNAPTLTSPPLSRAAPAGRGHGEPGGARAPPPPG